MPPTGTSSFLQYSCSCRPATEECNLNVGLTWDTFKQSKDRVHGLDTCTKADMCQIKVAEAALYIQIESPSYTEAAGTK